MGMAIPGGVGLVLVEMDTRHSGPRESVGVEQLGKKLGHVAEFVGLQSVNCGVLQGREYTYVYVECQFLCAVGTTTR